MCVCVCVCPDLNFRTILTIFTKVCMTYVIRVNPITIIICRTHELVKWQRRKSSLIEGTEIMHGGGGGDGSSSSNSSSSSSSNGGGGGGGGGGGVSGGGGGGGGASTYDNVYYISVCRTSLGLITSSGSHKHLVWLSKYCTHPPEYQPSRPILSILSWSPV